MMCSQLELTLVSSYFVMIFGHLQVPELDFVFCSWLLQFILMLLWRCYVEGVPNMTWDFDLNLGVFSLIHSLDCIKQF